MTAKEDKTKHPGIVALYTCNIWHAPQSFRLLAVIEEQYLEAAKEKIKKLWEYSDLDFEDYIHVEHLHLNDLDIQPTQYCPK